MLNGFENGVNRKLINFAFVCNYGTYMDVYGQTDRENSCTLYYNGSL